VARSSTAEPARRPRRTTASRLCSSGSVCVPRLLTSSLRVLIEAQAPGLYVCVFSPPSTVPQARCSHVCRRFEHRVTGHERGSVVHVRGVPTEMRSPRPRRPSVHFAARPRKAQLDSDYSRAGVAQFFPSALLASTHVVCYMYALKCKLEAQSRNEAYDGMWQTRIYKYCGEQTN
jgi:hypothetical protein